MLGRLGLRPIKAKISEPDVPTLLRGLGNEVALGRPKTTLKATGLRTLSERDVRPPQFSLFRTRKAAAALIAEESQIVLKTSGPEIRDLMTERAELTRAMQDRVVNAVEFGTIPLWFLDQMEDMISNSEYYVDVTSYFHGLLVKTCIQTILLAAATTNCSCYKLVTIMGRESVLHMPVRTTFKRKVNTVISELPDKPEITQILGAGPNKLDFLNIDQDRPKGFCFIDIDTNGRNGIKRYFPKSPLLVGYDQPKNRVPVLNPDDHIKAQVVRVFNVLMESYRAVLQGASSAPTTTVLTDQTFEEAQSQLIERRAKKKNEELKSEQHLDQPYGLLGEGDPNATSSSSSGVSVKPVEFDVEAPSSSDVVVPEAQSVTIVKPKLTGTEQETLERNFEEGSLDLKPSEFSAYSQELATKSYGQMDLEQAQKEIRQRMSDIKQALIPFEDLELDLKRTIIKNYLESPNFGQDLITKSVIKKAFKEYIRDAGYTNVDTLRGYLLSIKIPPDTTLNPSSSAIPLAAVDNANVAGKVKVSTFAKLGTTADLIDAFVGLILQKK